MKIIKQASVSSKKYIKRHTNQSSGSCTDFKCKHCLLAPGPGGCHCN